jgi:hypothetical protein
MNKILRLFPLLGISLILSLSLTGCLYDNPPSPPARSIDTWLVGQWQTKDKAGHSYSALVTPTTASDHYHMTFSKPAGGSQEFDGWISRVDDFPILVMKSLSEGPSFGKYSLYHYELLSSAPPPPGGIGAERIRLSELQLDESTRSLDPFNLRKAIRSSLKAGTLLAPFDTVAERKGKLDQTPGSVIWTKCGSVTLKGETF